ncbi:MAG: hypothetical protein Tsb0014_26940 [Pleurocapsa sp.]
MKLLQLPIKIILFLFWSLIATDLVRAQSGRMSDITVPNTQEINNSGSNVGNNTNTVDNSGNVGNNTNTVDNNVGNNTDTVDNLDNVGNNTNTVDNNVGNNTDTVDNSDNVGNNTDTVDNSGNVGNNTDTVDNSGNVGNNTDTVDNNAGNNTDTVDNLDNVGNNTDTVDNNVDNNTNTVDNNVGNNTNTVDNSGNVGNNTDTVDNNVGNNTDTVDNNVDNNTDTVDNNVGNNTNTVDNNVDNNTDTVDNNVGNNTDTVDNSDNAGNNTDTVDNSGNVGNNTGTADNNVGKDINSDNNSNSNSSDRENNTASGDNNSSDTDDSLDSKVETSNSTDSDTDKISSEVEDKVELEETEDVAQEKPLDDSEETEDVAETEKTDQEEKDNTEETETEKPQSDLDREVDRLAYEVQVQQSDPGIAVQMQEEFQAIQLMDSSGVQIYGNPPSAEAISQRLGQLWLQTGKKAAFINISVQSKQLESFVVLPTVSESAQKNNSNAKINNDAIKNPLQNILRNTVKDTSRKDLITTATQFREEVSDARKLRQQSYLKSAQQLYQVLIKPIEEELEANDIEILVFSMDSGLRLLPIAALHDGQQFLIEKYAVALVPSFGLTDTRYVSINESPILAMGASEFTEQAALPTMPLELETVVRNPRHGEIFLNEQFTVANFKAQNRRSKPFPIIHLGTHAEFKAGNLNDSYIQFYDEKVELPELRQISDQLGWNSSDATPVELLVLSACETALGNEKAELGFAGLAVQAGVKSALASLWYVSDLGTLALMSEFYDRLDDTLIKAEALRQTQLGMLKGEVLVSDRQVKLSNGESLALPSQFPSGKLQLSHPYFWSSFTLIGNWN